MATDLIIEHGRDDTVLLIKAAFEETPRVKNYTDNGYTIVGETGLGLMSYGARIIVELSETVDANQTPITVRSEKKVPLNLTNDHNKTKAQFIERLNVLRQYDIDDLTDVLAERMGVSQENHSIEHTATDGGGTTPTTTVVPNDNHDRQPQHTLETSEARFLPEFGSSRFQRWLKIGLLVIVAWILLNIVAAIINVLVIV